MAATLATKGGGVSRVTSPDWLTLVVLLVTEFAAVLWEWTSAFALVLVLALELDLELESELGWVLVLLVLVFVFVLVLVFMVALVCAALFMPLVVLILASSLSTAPAFTLVVLEAEAAVVVIAAVVVEKDADPLLVKNKDVRPPMWYRDGDSFAGFKVATLTLAERKLACGPAPGLIKPVEAFVLWLCPKAPLDNVP